MSEAVSAGDRTVGARIRLRRKQLGISERRMARILGIAPEDLEACERGERRLGADALAKAGKALNAPIRYFFCEMGTVARPGEIAPEASLLVAGAADFLSAYMRIGNSQLRDAVLRLVQRLARESRRAGSPTLGKSAGRERRSGSRAR